jgi:hypothetical protein
VKSEVLGEVNEEDDESQAPNVPAVVGVEVSVTKRAY